MELYGFTNDDTGDMSMSSNMMKVQVYLTSLNVEIVTESPTYEVCNFKIMNNALQCKGGGAKRR